MNYPALKELTRVFQWLKAQRIASATTVTGPSSTTGFDLGASTARGAAGDALGIVNIDAVGGTVDCVFKESTATNGTYTDVPGTAITQLAAGNNIALAVKIPNIAGRLQFLRVVVTTGAGTTATEVSATLLIGGYGSLPA